MFALSLAWLRKLISVNVTMEILNKQYQTAGPEMVYLSNQLTLSLIFGVMPPNICCAF